MIEFEKDRNPIISANRIIKSLDAIEFPVDVEKIAKQLNIQEITETDTDKFEGMLVALPDKSAGFINISENIREPTRKRFTIAHELGHYVIPTHESSYNCNKDDTNNYYDKKHPQEIEANHFAAELLMPRKYFLKEIERKEPSYDLIQNLTDKFESSLTSTLIRYKELTTENVAVVLSENSKIKWALRSDNFKYFIKSKVDLSPDSYAVEFFVRNDLSKKFEDVDPNVWFDDEGIVHKISVKELSIPLPYYSQVISLIWVIEDEDEIDEEDDDEFDGYLKLKEK